MVDLRAVLDMFDRAVVVTDPDGLIVLWSRAADRLYGWSEHEVARPIGARRVGAGSPHSGGFQRSGVCGERRLDVAGPAGSGPTRQHAARARVCGADAG